ncbi:hypothetical protein G6F35_016789 [Rhizopus arrhizus]|nr:hypothetical protein G6F35_016789 [Rhizopus arrhizus]
MRALLTLLALLLAPSAAALDLLPTTLQLPADGGHTALWLYNPGPGRWQGQRPDRGQPGPAGPASGRPPAHLAAAAPAVSRGQRTGLPGRARAQRAWPAALLAAPGDRESPRRSSSPRP